MTARTWLPAVSRSLVTPNWRNYSPWTLTLVDSQIAPNAVER